MPLPVLERHTEPEDQRVPLGGVVGPLIKPLHVLVEGAVAQLNSAGSRYRAGTLPAPVEVDGRPLHHLASILPHGPFQATRGAFRFSSNSSVSTTTRVDFVRLDGADDAPRVVSGGRCCPVGFLDCEHGIGTG